MASIMIHNQDDPLKTCVGVQAATRGRSIEDETRDILRRSLNQDTLGPKHLGSAIHALFRPLGGYDLPEVPREPTREPPSFDD